MKNGQNEVTKSLTVSVTNSFRQCSDHLFKFHVLTELELIGEALLNDKDLDIQRLNTSLEGRLKVLGPSLKEKQYLLALRRALLSLSKYVHL